MKKNKSLITHLLEGSEGFGTLDIIQRLPSKKRRRCDGTERQVKAIRATMDLDRIEMREELVILLLDDEQELIAGVPLYRGTSDEVNLDYRDIIQAAAIARACHVILAHNHPNGVVQPSKVDLNTASRIGLALWFAGFNLLDFYIITKKKHFSFSDNGLIEP